ncbi:MAG: SIS domain-containing protein [Rudaea sp.]|nr:MULTISPECIES: SIS domain-containing protein [unclassified Rudaea]MBN8887197.1 SIS domain-containing protein [Rudaea sp.]MBR0345176.1 SIS domain-containing protein [Rudaea sp.]
MDSSTPSIELGRLLAGSAEEQQRAGYADTLREILQQPQTWRDTAALLAGPAAAAILSQALISRPEYIVLTGSGSSVHAGECLAGVLQAALRIPCRAIPAGDLLTNLRGMLPPGSGLVMSIARSGDSPESAAVVDSILAAAPACAHLVVTCNANGRLATRYRSEPRVRVLLLDARTNDRSLVMTSSFTNMLLAGGALVQSEAYAAQTTSAADVAQRLFDRHADALAMAARKNFSAAVYLASGPGLGAARESALKMLEMSGGAAATMAETFLGLRHGPMSALNRPSLVVAFLSAQANVRDYEYDLLRELERKRLGLARVIVGEGIPAGVVAAGDLAIDLPGLNALGDTQRHMIDVVVGQLLAFFRCLHLGQKPDAPSAGVLTRVVEEFVIHAAGEAR